MPNYTNTIDYNTWLEENEDELNCVAGESGADRELDFNLELFQEEEYEAHHKYLKMNKNITSFTQ